MDIPLLPHFKLAPGTSFVEIFSSFLGARLELGACKIVRVFICPFGTIFERLDSQDTNEDSAIANGFLQEELDVV